MYVFLMEICLSMISPLLFDPRNLYTNSILVGCSLYMLSQLFLFSTKCPDVVELVYLIVAGLVGGVSMFLFKAKYCWLCDTLGPWSVEVMIENLSTHAQASRVMWLVLVSVCIIFITYLMYTHSIVSVPFDDPLPPLYWWAVSVGREELKWRQPAHHKLWTQHFSPHSTAKINDKSTFLRKNGL